MTEATLSEAISVIVRRLFRQQQQQPRAARAGARQATHASSASPPLAARIPREIPAAKLQLVGLARVKDALGSRWPQLADRVHDIAQTVINKHLLPGDMAEQNGDHDYLVLFAQLAPEDAHFKAQAISREIERRLIGCNLTDIAQCSAEIVMVDVEGLPGQDDFAPQRTNPRPRGRPLSRAALGIVSPPTGARRPPDTNTPEDRAASIQPDADVPGSTPAPPEPESTEPSRPVLERRDRPRHTAEIAWRYRPVWDFRNSALILFALLPRPSEKSVWDHDAVVAPGDMELRAELDVAAIIKAAGDFLELSKSGRRLPLLVQVHHETVANARRQAFILSTIKKIPPQFRRLLLIEIVGRPRNENLPSVSSFIRALRAIEIRTAIRIDPGWLTFHIETCGARMITATLPTDWSEPAKMDALNLMAQRTAEAKIDCGVWKLATRSIVLAAISAGIRFLSGPAVACDTQSVSCAIRYSLEDLYLQS